MFEQSGVLLQAGSLNPLIRRLEGLEWELIRAHKLYVAKLAEKRGSDNGQSAEINTGC